MKNLLRTPRTDILAKTLTLTALVYFGLELVANTYKVFSSNTSNPGNLLFSFLFASMPFIFFYIAYRLHSKQGYIWRIYFEAALAAIAALFIWDRLAKTVQAFSLTVVSQIGTVLFCAAVTAAALWYVLHRLRAQRVW